MSCDKCTYCDNTDGLEWHHILPKSLGGPDEAFNLIQVCNVHHALLHGMSNRGNIAELTKAGLDKAKGKGVVLGPKWKVPPQILTSLCEGRAADKTLDELSGEFNIDRTTIGRITNKWKNNLDEYTNEWEIRQMQYSS